MICLDTNIAIYVINRRVPSVRHRLAEQLRLGTEIGFPVIALFELRYGHAPRTRPLSLCMWKVFPSPVTIPAAS